MSAIQKIREIELLAPARNLEIGIEAINHGADAIYIGGPKFSARSAAGNSIEDIEALVNYAHLFGVKIYVAFNTIMNDKELKDAESMIWKLHEIGVDALIVQDMGITMLNLPPISLHGSTQIDNRNFGKVRFLEEVGFGQVVLARELNKDEIKDISSQTSVTLEAFVHGALCVCYSGQCYLSEALAKRSANRGSCAQFCRLPYDLVDSNNKTVVQKKHLLSMKDLNLSEHLEEMMDAGVSSLKIEGRLKDMSYVKNTVAYYRQKIDQIIEKHPDRYKRSSVGISTFSFAPDLYKSFNRGFTSYFFEGRGEETWSLNSPKSIGEPIGKISEIAKNHFRIDTKIELANGDGLCFLNSEKELEGLRINNIENGKIFVTSLPPQLKRGMFVYRNFDHAFEKQLSNKTAVRKIPLSIKLSEDASGFVLESIDCNNNRSILNFDYKKELAQKDQLKNIESVLSKTGDTIFSVDSVEINMSENWFIPSSLLTDWRRQLIDAALETQKKTYIRKTRVLNSTDNSYPEKEITYLGNVLNEKSKKFYEHHNAEVVEDAFEKNPLDDVALMFTRHCIKQSMGWCPKESKVSHPYQEPFFLNHNETKLKLVFDCKKCEMQVFKA